MRRTLVWLALLAPATALAQAEEFENPGTVSAVQERLYRMTHELTLGVGTLPLDAFYKGLTAQVGYAYHFSDSFAWQVARGSYSYNLDTGLRQQLERDFGVLPTAFDEVQWLVGSDLMFSPFYGKTALFNRSVIHTSAHLILGGSVLKFTNEFRPALNVGLGARLFASRNLSLRLDVTDNVVFATGKASAAVQNVINIQLLGALNFGSSE